MIKDEMFSRLNDSGTDIEATINRFMGNEQLYFRFAFKFLEDTNMYKLEEYLEQGNIEEAFKCAHTLKGVVANLGFTNISFAVNPLVDYLRKDDLESARSLLEELKKQYNITCSILNEYKDKEII